MNECIYDASDIYIYMYERNVCVHVCVCVKLKAVEFINSIRNWKSGSGPHSKVNLLFWINLVGYKIRERTPLSRLKTKTPTNGVLVEESGDHSDFIAWSSTGEFPIQNTFFKFWKQHKKYGWNRNPVLPAWSNSGVLPGRRASYQTETGLYHLVHRSVVVFFLKLIEFTDLNKFWKKEKKLSNIYSNMCKRNLQNSFSFEI